MKDSYPLRDNVLHFCRANMGRKTFSFGSEASRRFPPFLNLTILTNTVVMREQLPL